MKRLWIGIVLLAGGCASSAPLRLYTLSEVAPQGAAAAGSTSSIRVARVKVPAELDRPEVVQRVDANRVRIAEQDRWAAPLDDMIRRVLAADLQARGAGAPSDAAAVSIDIEEFMGDMSCAVVLRASWEIKGGGSDGGVASTGRESIQIPAKSSAECVAGSLPLPMSQAVAELSDRILAASR